MKIRTLLRASTFIDIKNYKIQINYHSSFLAYKTINGLGAWKNYRITYTLFKKLVESYPFWGIDGVRGGGMQKGLSC